MERWRGQPERHHLVPVAPFEVTPHVDPRQEGVTDLRWWTLVEIEASRETFAPRSLAALLRELIERGPPTTPIDVGV
jgi:hypothetical protein